MSTKNAFKLLLGLQGRTMTIQKADFSLEEEIKAAPSNFFRNFQGPEDTVFEGREFVIDSDYLTTFGVPSIGDRLIDPDLGENVFVQIRPMFDLGGAIMGYRVRTS